MSQDTDALENEVRRLFERLDALDISGLGEMLTDDVQGVDEITRAWTRGRSALEAYFAQLEGAISEPHSQTSDLNAAAWGDTGLVTFVLDQTYTLDGELQKISAPTSILFRREGDTWKVALIHTVPWGDQDVDGS